MAAEDVLHVFFDERVLDYDTGSGFFELAASPLLEVVEKHPENADRLRNIRSALAKGPIGARRARRRLRGAAAHCTYALTALTNAACPRAHARAQRHGCSGTRRTRRRWTS